MQRGATCCYRYSKSPFSTQGVRCVDDKRRYSVDEASAFVEPAPPSCGYLHISISSAQHRGGAVDVWLKYMDADTRTPSHTTFLPRAEHVCVFHCLCVRRRYMCREDPMEKIPLSWTTITTPGYRERKYTHLEAELYQCIGILLRYTELQRAHAHTSWGQCVCVCMSANISICVCTISWGNASRSTVALLPAFLL